MRDEACQSFRDGSAGGWGGGSLTVGGCPQVIARRVNGMTPVLHYPLFEPHNARGIPAGHANWKMARG